MKKLNALRFLFFYLYTFFALGVPILLIMDKYALAVKNSEYKATGMGIIVALIVLYYLRGQFKELIESLEDGTTKVLSKESMRVIPILILYFALQFAEVQMHNFKFIVLWSFVSNIIAAMFKVYHLKYLNRVKKLRKASEGR